jgi:dTDP-4-dehydrorhamnose 3,5-epimerase
MEFHKKEIEGVFEIIPDPHADERGFFMRTYDAELFKLQGLHREWVQENHSRSEKQGIIRGLHFQIAPFSETKLIRCIKGRIFDVAVDLRKNSPTFGKWTGVELTEEDKKMFFIPRGFAHGFCTISDLSEVVYKVDNFYSPVHERGILWNDPDLKIEWPVVNPILSAKDQKNMSLREFMGKSY